jgi:acylphosphatase
VFFRDACSRQAIGDGVTGWVRNTGDGRVEAVFEGDATAVHRLVAWCRHGPPRAVVTSVEVVDETPQGEPYFRTS